MEIKINETGKTEVLTLIDPKTGCEWIIDLISNNAPDSFGYNDDDGVYTMNQSDYLWWENMAKFYQQADNEYHEIRGNVDNPEDLDAYLFDQNIGSCELEYYPQALTAAVEEWLSTQE